MTDITNCLCLLMEDMFAVLSSVVANRSPTVLRFDSKCESTGSPEFSLLQIYTSSSHTDMPHVEVDHVLCVGALDRDSKGFEGVEGEGNQPSHSVIYWPPQQACLDLKLQQAGIPRVKPGG